MLKDTIDPESREHLAGDIASALFGVDGLRVVEAETEADGTLTVWAVTGHPGAAVCRGCGTRAGRVDKHVLARPRDQRRGLDEVSLCWLRAANRSCAWPINRS